jgi:AcrR family transcriptional regulator
MPKSVQPRRRNAEATRTAILASARRAFARAGYDGVGVREIAAGAGVSAMMVNRYFGSKEQLFAAVVAGIMTTPMILTPGNLASRSLGAALAEGIVQQTAPGATPLDGFLIMMHSASSERAAEIARVQIEQHYHEQLSRALGGGFAPERAAIILAIVAGVQAMRQVMRLSALAQANPASLTAILTPVFDQLVARPRPARRRRPKSKTD